jgi:hypothetical protein
LGWIVDHNRLLIVDVIVVCLSCLSNNVRPSPIHAPTSANPSPENNTENGANYLTGNLTGNPRQFLAIHQTTIISL